MALRNGLFRPEELNLFITNFGQFPKRYRLSLFFYNNEQAEIGLGAGEKQYQIQSRIRQRYPSPVSYTHLIIAYDDENFGGGTSVTNSCWRQMGPYVRQYAIANGKAINKDTVTGFMTAIGQASMAYQKNNTRPAEVLSLIHI